MDLNSAIYAAEAGGIVRDDASMATGWTMRYIAVEKLFYYFDPKGEKRHRVRFNDTQRASYQWRIAE